MGILIFLVAAQYLSPVSAAIAVPVPVPAGPAAHILPVEKDLEAGVVPTLKLPSVPTPIPLPVKLPPGPTVLTSEVRNVYFIRHAEAFKNRHVTSTFRLSAFGVCLGNIIQIQ